MARLIPLTAPLLATLHSRPMEVSVALFTAISCVFVSSKGYTSAWVSLAVPVLGLAAMTTQSAGARFAALAGMAGVLVALVLVNFYDIANHGFVLAYLGIALTLAAACDPPRDTLVLRRLATAMLALMMALALIQKLRSPYYMDGDLLGSLIISGDIYANLIGLFVADWPQRLAEYRAAFDALLVRPDAASSAIVVPAAIVGLAWRMTWGSILAQAALEGLILMRHRAGIVLHLALLGFVVLVYTTRNENIFLSINCLLGYAMTDERTRAARPWYVVATLYLLSAEMIGLRPWIIS